MISFYLSMVQTDDDKNKVIFIYENYYSFMCYTAGRILNNNKHDVEDAVHNAMVALIENLDKIDFSDAKKVKNLCGIVAKNKAIDSTRSKDNKAISLEEEIPHDHTANDDPGDIVIKKGTYETVLSEIRMLDDKYRDVCILKYIYELKEKEIASILNISPNTVSTRIFRGKQILRDALVKEGVYEI